jgi:hypothetical protein
MSLMRVFVLCSALVLVLSSPGQTPRQTEPAEPRLPDGRSQKEEILKADHAKSLDDASELMKLSEELKIDLEKNDRHVLSVATLKKLDEMEKLVKRIRGRMKRF